jgi:hypothetical protein
MVYLGNQPEFKDIITDLSDRDCRLLYDFKTEICYLNIPYYSKKINDVKIKDFNFNYNEQIQINN